MEVRTNKHLNIFTDYLKGSKTALKNKYVQNNTFEHKIIMFLKECIFYSSTP